MNKTNPDYYMKDKKVDPVTIIRLLDLNFNVGNAVKYIARAGKKDGESYTDDLRKAETYLGFEIEYIVNGIDVEEVNDDEHRIVYAQDYKIVELLFDYIIDDWGIKSKCLSNALKNIFLSSKEYYYEDKLDLLKEAEMYIKNAIAAQDIRNSIRVEVDNGES